VAAAASLTGFEATIARAAEGFVGRDWLDREIDAFIGNEGRYAEGAPFLLLFGEPGVGKTAYAAHLARERRWLHYFCSRLHPGLLDPGRFARNLGSQLFERFGDDYARVVATQQHVDVTAEQRVGTIEVGGQAVNVYIENLVASDPLELFSRLVADPLVALLSERRDETVVLVIDGLDEARTYRGRVTILDLVAAALDLPAAVRTVATSRPDRQLQRLLAGAAVLDLKDFASDLERDAAAYVGDGSARRTCAPSFARPGSTPPSSREP
jgi:AAA ATPase domain